MPDHKKKYVLSLLLIICLIFFQGCALLQLPFELAKIPIALAKVAIGIAQKLPKPPPGVIPGYF